MTVGSVVEVMVYRLAAGGGVAQSATVLSVEGDVVELALPGQRVRWSRDQVQRQAELAARSRLQDAWARVRAERAGGNVSAAEAPR